MRQRSLPSSGASHKCPRNWYEFLRLKEKEKELFAFLVQIVPNKPLKTYKMILSTYHDNELCNLPCDRSRLAPSTQEEADTRIFLHLKAIIKECCDKVRIRTVITDVVVASQCPKVISSCGLHMVLVNMLGFWNLMRLQQH